MATRRRQSTSWEGVADWYRELAGRRGPELVSRIVYPEMVRLLGNVRDRRVLDVGCGPGALARLLAYRGARVTGVDASPRMVELARADAEEAGLKPLPRFEVGDAERSDGLPSGPFDCATLALSLQNMERPDQVFANVASRLDRRARMVLALNHPSFRNPGATHWGWDPEKRVQFRRVDEYRSHRRAEIQIHPGSDPSLVRPSFHWPLETLFGALRSAGFRVLDLTEPTSDRVSEGGRADAENRAREEIPLFCILLADRIPPKRAKRERSG